VPRRLWAGGLRRIRRLRVPGVARVRNPRERTVARAQDAWAWLVVWARRITWGVCALGLMLVLVGTLMVTVFAPGPTVSARISGTQGAPSVETMPGVLSVLGSQVTIEATAATPEAPVFVGIGRTGDVETFLGPSLRTQVTGVAGEARLIGHERIGEPILPDPAGADVWAVSTRAQGRVRLVWRDQPGQWSMVVAGTGQGGGPGSVTLSWPREKGAAAPALIALGVLLMVSGLVGAALLWAHDREEEGLR
jgi:hypothetical protein